MFLKLSSKRILLMLAMSLYCVLTGYGLLTASHNGDGIEYAAAARNMAEGWGSFWSPYLSDTIHPVFHEHPPLVIWIQSLLFRIFGDGRYFEGVYGFFIGLLILYGTALFWRRVGRDFQFSLAGCWWPMLLFISVPFFTYIVQTNRLIVTFTVFAIWASYVSYLSVTATNRTALFGFLAGVLVYLGVIAKGPVAVFTFAVPTIAWLTLRIRFSRAMLSTLLSIVTCAAIFVAICSIYPESLVFWKKFWHQQIIASLNNTRAPRGTHWYLVEQWIREMAVPLGLCMVLAFATRKSVGHPGRSRQALFFWLVALAASLPFLASERQRFRYILQSLPFYILALSFLTERIAGRVEAILDARLQLRNGMAAAAMVGFVIAVATMLYRQDAVTKRVAFYQDFYFPRVRIPERITVSVCPLALIHDEWLFADMQRHYKVSLTGEMGHEYLILDKRDTCTLPPGYQRVHQQPTMRYVLYKKTAPSG